MIDACRAYMVGKAAVGYKHDLL